MDIRLHCAVISSVSSSPWSNPIFRSHQTALKPLCSRRHSQRNGDNTNDDDDKLSIDWDKAWSSFKKNGKKTFFSQFSPDRYVTWNPTRSNYPPSEEVDPIKRSEKLNLNLWTSPQFTIAVTILILVFLLVYTVVFPLK
ncbi:unnamed protein product [Cuscuta campestris]|uniref:Uncharacterized protein n=2 Tax=Cuscuta sect. Cleistogrammica TaxID=1824901 RepID=A0A484KDG4_9ASTE|nr:hypothetical protein DM860_014624 [Cuscuta australis]VFQ61924.1 unnamed protein product [Cuscuta campestris]